MTFYREINLEEYLQNTAELRQEYDALVRKGLFHKTDAGRITLKDRNKLLSAEKEEIMWFNVSLLRQIYPRVFTKRRETTKAVWNEDIIWKAIKGGETAAAKPGNASKLMQGALQEIIAVLKTLLLELILKYDYHTDSVRNLVAKDVRKKIEDLQENIRILHDRSTADIHQKQNGFLNIFETMFHCFLSEALISIRKVIEADIKHLSYRHLLLTEAVRIVMNKMGDGWAKELQQSVYKEYMEKQGIEDEAEQMRYLSEEIELFLEHIAHALISKVEFNDVKADLKFEEKRDIVLTMGYVPTPVEFESLVELYGPSLKAVMNTKGSPNSHYALMAKSLGIPVFILPEEHLIHFEDKRRILVLGDGSIILSPSAERKGIFEKKQKEAERLRHYEEHIAQEITDKNIYSAFANADNPEEIARVIIDLADAIGLVRTENWEKEIYSLPLDALVDQLKKILQPTGRLVTFRTIDTQGDKMPLPFSFVRYEGNKWYLDHPLGRAVFVRQIRAFLRVWKGSFRGFKVMFPMIESAADLKIIEALIKEAKSLEGVTGDIFECGAMIETPEAVKNIDEILACPLIKFISFGTNDLIRFLYKVDRTDPEQYHEYYKKARPLVAKIIRNITSKANGEGV
ncbi:MAG: hypothetical protein KAS92_03230, partial [Candidatus Omnitrophica bacterium]|nr:hypothetical protein [Candidatus Omnitrophota bacterium]